MKTYTKQETLELCARLIYGDSLPENCEIIGIINHPEDGQIGVLLKLQFGTIAHAAGRCFRNI